jgi:hypothetical protein
VYFFLGGGYYLRSRHRPNLEIIRPHIHIGNAIAKISYNPLIKILRLSICNPSVERGVNQGLDTFYLVLFGEHRDVILKWEGDPALLVAYVGDALVSVPVVRRGEGFADAVVEVFVV